MNTSKKSGFIIGGIIILLGIYVAVTYNGLVKKQEKVSLQWNEVNNTYQRRLDLIPNLVNVVKGQADFEKETLEKIAAARTKAAAAITITGAPTTETVQASNHAQNELATATNRFIAVIEKYPDLKGTEAFRGLQTQLEGTERRIKFARNDFNEAVANYNNAVRSFPSSVVAGMLGFTTQSSFQSDAGAQNAIEIKF